MQLRDQHFPTIALFHNVFPFREQPRTFAKGSVRGTYRDLRLQYETTWVQAKLYHSCQNLLAASR